MATNENVVKLKYNDTQEDNRASLSRFSALEFYYTKRHLDGLVKKTDKVLELGCATGHYAFYYADKCKEYIGVDIVPEHIEAFNKKINESDAKNISCKLGDATNLDGFDDNSFDVVLCLGPMYHLPHNEREIVFKECARVCKKGGLLAFAYINKVGVYAGGCIIDSNYPTKEANVCVLENGTDDIRPDLFFFTMPEEIEEVANKNGLSKIKNLGTDFLMTMKIVNEMDDEKFELMKPLYDQMTSYESCTGMSNHALLVCTKN